MFHQLTKICGAVATAALLMTGTAMAAPDAYRFESVGQPVRSGEKTVISVRMIHLPDGNSVRDAVITPTRFDMGATRMAFMTASAKSVPAAEPDVYQVEAKPGMSGNWVLSLAAQVPAETEPVRGSVVVSLR